MSEPKSQEITRLLLDWGNGNKAALDELMPIVYDELRRLAKHYMRGQRAGHTLQTTALVNEAYLRLIDSSRVNWQNRTHFFAISAQMMRRILVDFARIRNSQKRGGENVKVTFDEQIEVPVENETNLIALDEALENLAKLNLRQSQIVELRYFGGLSEEEIAAALKISVRTVRRDWSVARAWLYRELKQT
ncbi:MAG TPA: sigma-70 family RNA polymerase sigma factor [Pyrinomonadaceae bacterium]|jgi:RNA polymerase sigma factor (TIGR02999 family)